VGIHNPGHYDKIAVIVDMMGSSYVTPFANAFDLAICNVYSRRPKTGG
jgi:hypothetical protein